MRSAPKKYLVETEDGGVEDTGLGQEEYYGYEPENRMKNRDWGVGTL